jgi:MFS family permease
MVRRRLHPNVWVTSGTSFLTDVSSEMLQNVLPLFLANVLGVRTWAVGMVEGLAETTAAVVKLYSGWMSDRMRARKWLAVGGYSVSALSKPFYLLASTWPVVAAVRWSDRVGKGIRSAPRDALLADSVPADQRGLAFGLHRAADTGGAVVGLFVTILVVGSAQGGGRLLEGDTFRTLVLWSLAPALLAVLLLAIGARDVPVVDPPQKRPRLKVTDLGSGFGWFLVASAVFEAGNSSDAFLILRAQERGLGVVALLWTLLGFNVVYTLVSAPAGSLSDRMPRKWVLLGSWIIYSLVYVGFAAARTPFQVVVLFTLYGAYHGMNAAAAKALVADLVPADLRGTAYGTWHAVVGLLSLPASVFAGLLWEGFGAWTGLGGAAPFWFGAAAALAASAILVTAVPSRPVET